MTVTVAGLGQRYGGDDAVGLEVISALEQDPPAGVVLRRLREPSALVELLAGAGRVVVVDALDDPDHLGAVAVRDLSALSPDAPGGLSSHGLGVAQAAELARTLYGGRAEVCFVTISVDASSARQGPAQGLSAPVAAAVAVAATRIRSLLAEARAAEPLTAHHWETRHA